MIAKNFADFAVGSRTKGLDAQTYAAAGRAAMDWFGATIAGSVMEPAQALRRAFVFTEGAGRSALVPSSRMR